MKVGLQVKCHSDPRRLQFLTPEKSWDLFEKRVFGEGRCPAELSYVGHQIGEKCKGLPLAVVLIVGVPVRVRKGKKKENEKYLWLKIQHNLDSIISANNNLQTMKVMQLSYDHLPYHLKSSLLYFTRSQKRKRTLVSKLMQLWMAEGFVDHDIPSKSSLEEATQSYLDALISSGLIMVDHIPSKKRTWTFSDMIKVFYVHDVVHDFCSVESKKIETLDLKVIPLSWLNLQNLETLLIRTQYSTIVLLPRTLKLSKLKHISIDNRSSFFENKEDADNIMHQQSRILEAENSKLTTLSQVQISYSEGTNDALEKFPNLQHLDCVIEEPTDPPTHNDWFPKFNVLNKLESLIAGYGNDSELID
ncbi:hypothetical protein RDI58_007358 [Solanum bulbocastanum]|uniref:Disease resistance protein winged helix domain-containing protein n=1 Tax=Solanum bulbocastanum TaxID=147425 RepID=A0AAN8TUY1_SOLBU